MPYYIFLSFFFFSFSFLFLNIKCSAPHLWQTLDLDNSFLVYLFNVGPNTLLSTVILMLDVWQWQKVEWLSEGGAGRSSEVERSLMVRWVVGSILHGVDPLSYFSFQPVLHDWCNKGHGMCFPVCGMVHIKEPLLLIGKSSLCGGSGFPFSLSEWSLTICLTPYNRR